MKADARKSAFSPSCILQFCHKLKRCLPCSRVKIGSHAFFLWLECSSMPRVEQENKMSGVEAAKQVYRC
jgi:hypothetical protein